MSRFPAYKHAQVGRSWALPQVSPLWRWENAQKAQLHCPHLYPASPSPSSAKWTCVRPVLMTMTTTTATSVFLGRGRQHWTRRMSSLSRLHLTKGKKTKNSLHVWAATLFSNTAAAQSMKSVSRGGGSFRESWGSRWESKGLVEWRSQCSDGSLCICWRDRKSKKQWKEKNSSPDVDATW